MLQKTIARTACLIFAAAIPLASLETLEEELKSIGAKKLAIAARKEGDARRGAVVFYRRQLACTRCHVAGDQANRLGPDLTTIEKEAGDEHLITSILDPSKVIRKGFAPVVLEKGDDIITGFLVSEKNGVLVIRDAERNYKEVEYKRSELDSVDKGKVSLMPAGLANLLTSKQQFYDLVRYLMEIRDGGSKRARELEPEPSLYADRPVPEYEGDIDHAGLIRGLDRDALQRGKKIYQRLCINCHGTRDEVGSLPTSMKFAVDRFKNGSDPFTMYQTLTRGFGMMVAQTWMVPSQKYDVIHYIREEYLRKHNASQFFEVDDAYLDRLPKGKSLGPAPSRISKWEQMDYGPNQVMTVEIGNDARNFAYKGNAIRLDAGSGGVAQGRYWMVYDYDTMRVAAAWSGEGFIDWKCVHLDGSHKTHPRVVGEVHVANPTGPGWGRPRDGSFEDTRLVGRDGRLYGPLPRKWAQYKGMYYHGPNTIVEYTVGGARVREMPGVHVPTISGKEQRPLFTRTFNIGPRKTDLLLQVAHTDEAGVELATNGANALFGKLARNTGAKAKPAKPIATKGSRLNGATRLQIDNVEGLNAGTGDFTITARIKTKKDGTILAQTERSPKWGRNGLTFFVRGGKLHVDIGWVGVFGGRRRVADGKWHDVAFSYAHETGEIRLYVDGKPEKGTGRLRRKQPLKKPVVRIGYTADNFPKPSYFDGEISNVGFYNRVLTADRIKTMVLQKDKAVARAKNRDGCAAYWDLTAVANNRVADETGNQHDAKIVAGEAPPKTGRVSGVTLAGFEGNVSSFEWLAAKRDLRLKIPAGDKPRRFTLWVGSAEDRKSAENLTDAVVIDDPDQDLTPKTLGGPSRWPQVLASEALIAADDGPFAVDVLKRPTNNPWFCRLRLTGFDFTPDGDSAIVSAWDGSIWKVSGLGKLPAESAQKSETKAETKTETKTKPKTTTTIPITWRRIASGLFQPLGVKIVDGKIYVTCRDQLCILHDLNGDDEIDWFESFNNDHQVTEHFHEFAMGLQADKDGNFYYAKSARHAKTAVVPHHGTLLRVSKDGSRTDIVATGFRAANGVCLNPDGTFIVTDQEGHWNPKNRINYVKEGGFYGNMYGYHDVTDSSDDAMEQPLVWITNEFDRSPGELLWVDSAKWGPLNKRLLNLSYGYGEVYIVPHEDVGGQMQGGMCSFPIKRFPTGIMRGRFHPADGQLYLAGMFAWSGNQNQPGGLYRLRYTGQPVHLPVALSATKKGVTVTFSGRLDPKSAATASNYHVKVWGLKRTKKYGSKHYNEHGITVASAKLDANGRTVHLEIPEIAPTWGMEIKYAVRSAQGRMIKGRIHNTIHKLKD